MALYGARTLPGEPSVAPASSGIGLINDLVAEVVRGQARSELLLASELLSLVDLHGHGAGRRDGENTSQDLKRGEIDTDHGPQTLMTDLSAAVDDPHDPDAGHFASPIIRRQTLTPEQIAGGVRTRTRLSQFYQGLGIEPTINPGLDGDAPPIDAVGTTQYALGTTIGEGGAGRVLLAVDRDLRRSVAIKVLQEKHRSNPLLLQAFIEEAIITGGLEHPNIVPVYQLGYNEDLGPYYVMKRLDGITLGAALQGLRKKEPEMEARFDLDRLLQILIEICQGLIYAHDRQVIHCDLKPNNILVGNYGEVMIVDWGLAFVMGDLGAMQARSHFWSGTPGFMAPEQVIGDPTAYDVRTDIWALGGILYAMLSLTRPFTGRTKHETLDAVMTGELLPPSQRNPQRKVPAALEQVCMKALSRTREDRFDSVAQFMGEIENHLAGRRRLRQRIELGQKALSDVRELLEPLAGTEAVLDALQARAMDEGDRNRQAAMKRDLQEVRDSIAEHYSEAVRVGCEAMEAGAHHPPLELLLGDVYWRVFKRLYPARVPANRHIQQQATELLRRLSAVALQAISTHTRRLAPTNDTIAPPITSGGGRDVPPPPPGAPPLPTTERLGPVEDTTPGLPREAIGNAPPPPLPGVTPTDDDSDAWLESVLAYCGPEATAADADRAGVAAQLGKRLAFLRSVTLFQGLPGMELLPIAEACEKRTFAPGMTIFREGDYGDALYIIAHGNVNIMRGNAVINTLDAGRCLGEIAIIDGTTRTATAICATEVISYRLKADRFRKIIADNGTVALGVMKVLAQRMREATHREEALRQHVSRRGT